jgi:hypothetical protein
VGGATVTLSSGGTTVATVVSGAEGATYSFTNVPYGSYTVLRQLYGDADSGRLHFRSCQCLGDR